MPVGPGIEGMVSWEEGSLVSFTHMALELGKRNDIFIDSFLEDIGLGWLAHFRLPRFRLV
jgi:hypothetical protein